MTVDHDEIKRWVEERGGSPSIVKSTKTGSGERESGLLRIDFGEQDENLEPIEWDEFFRIFDKNDLAFLYQEETADGDESFFNKFVSRETAEDVE